MRPRSILGLFTLENFTIVILAVSKLSNFYGSITFLSVLPLWTVKIKNWSYLVKSDIAFAPKNLNTLDLLSPRGNHTLKGRWHALQLFYAIYFKLTFCWFFTHIFLFFIVVPTNVAGVIWFGTEVNGRPSSKWVPGEI